MIAALLACSCPSFDEMEIVAMDASATDHPPSRTVRDLP